MASKDFEVTYGGIQYIGIPLDINGYKLFSMYDRLNVIKTLRTIGKQDHILYLRNSWALSQSYNHLVDARAYSKDIILYSPVEEEKLPMRYFDGWNKIPNHKQDWYDRLITMTKHSKDIITATTGISDNVYSLYHAMDMGKLSKTNVYSDTSILNISYGQDYRKNLGLYLMLAKLNHRYDFYWIGKSQYYVIRDYREIYNIKNFHIINELNGLIDGGFVNNSQLGTIYSQAHYYFQTSYKEGFDLTVMEALCNGLITFMPDDALHRELFGDFNNAIFVQGTYDFPSMNQIEMRISPMDYNLKFKANKDRKKTGTRVPDRFNEKQIYKEFKDILVSV
jgi:hypothetical protein